MKIAIIGAGLSGTTLYNFLRKDGHDVTLFEKSRGVGGRCSTRYLEKGYLDHGTAFFEAENPRFIRFCEQKVSENILRKEGKVYYPTSGMNKLCASLIDAEKLIKNTKIVSCNFQDRLWRLEDENQNTYGGFDKLIISIPTPQVLALNMTINREIKAKLATVEYDAMATLLLYSKNKVPKDINARLMALDALENNIFKKIINNASKYDYEDFSSYIIHLDTILTKSYNFTEKEAIKSVIIAKIYEFSAIKLEDFFEIEAHFWKYALVSHSLEDAYLYEAKQALGFCGDYCKGEHLQSAYLSAKRLYDAQFRDL